MSEEYLKKIANKIRKKIITEVYLADSGHIGGSLSAVEILVELYFEQMDVTFKNLSTIDRDRFVLSKGHASPALYAVLSEKKFISDDDLKTFRQINGNLQGHPNMNDVKGIDMSTGSLGQGISCAVGMAIANKADKNNHLIYFLLGDGECEEGEVWEALMSASHYKLNNLCGILDYNHLQINGNIDDVISPEPFKSKFESFGWNVVECNGHDFTSLKKAFSLVKKENAKPSIIIAHTVKGKGISFMENEASWHGKVPSESEYKKALIELEGRML